MWASCLSYEGFLKYFGFRQSLEIFRTKKHNTFRAFLKSFENILADYPDRSFGRFFGIIIAKPVTGLCCVWGVPFLCMGIGRFIAFTTPSEADRRIFNESFYWLTGYWFWVISIILLCLAFNSGINWFPITAGQIHYCFEILFRLTHQNILHSTHLPHAKQ